MSSSFCKGPGSPFPRKPAAPCCLLKVSSSAPARHEPCLSAPCPAPGGPSFPPPALLLSPVPLRPLAPPSPPPDGSTVLPKCPLLYFHRQLLAFSTTPPGGSSPAWCPSRFFQDVSPQPLREGVLRGCRLPPRTLPPRLPLRAQAPKSISVHFHVSAFRVLSKHRKKGRI